jgi:hypothetical protein
LHFSHGFLRRFLIVPEVRGIHPFADGFQLLLLAIEVKDTPEGERSAASVLRICHAVRLPWMSDFPVKMKM